MKRLFSFADAVFIQKHKALMVIIAVTAVLIFSSDLLADTVTPRIMPLGDSITRGWYGSVYRWGYRKPLYDRLTSAGFNFDFVGIKADGSFADPSHEGRDGWQANELLNGRPSAPAEGKLADWLITDQPDVILLHIGTNDVTWSDINPNDVNGILNVINAYEFSSGRHITVFIALIINRRIDSPAYKRAQTTQFNIDVNNIAVNRIACGDDIIIVNMENALNYNIGVDMADEVHPNDNGYIKMADVWYNALADYYYSNSISGYVLEADGITPVEGALIQADDDLSEVTDADGFYELFVPYNWSGVVVPQKAGFNFEPSTCSFSSVRQDYTSVNFSAEMMTYKISGFVRERDLITPMSDINVSAENGGGSWTSRYGGGSALTDTNGYYELYVDYNWTGDVTPSGYACAFEPGFLHYQDVNGDYTGGDYTGNLYEFRITGFVKNDCNVPVAGVLVDADNGGTEDVTGADGSYKIWIDRGWSGTISLTREHYIIEPNTMSYIDVQADITDQNYIANSAYDLDCDGSIGWGDLSILTYYWLSDGPDSQGDFNGDGTVNFLDYADFERVRLEQ
jgi:lysophospholipase L1-like esterase